MFSVFLQFILSGLTTGAVYALVGLGFNIIYNTTSIINLAQGEFVVAGGLLMWFYVESLKLPFLLSAILTVISVGIIGYLIERLTIRHVKKSDLLVMIMITIAVSIVLKGAAMFVFGKEPYGYRPFTEGEPLIIAGAVIQQQALWVMGLTFICIVVMYIFFNRTMLGKAMRACAINPVAAGLSGIDVEKMITIAFVMSAVIGAIGGIAITPVSLMEYDKGAMLTVKGFCASIMGGLGRGRGSVIGGFLLGIMESLTAGYIHSGFKDAVALVILLAILFFRPAGLFGSKEIMRMRRF